MKPDISTITARQVRQALDAMRRGAPPETNELLGLETVRRRAREWSSVPNAHSLEMALYATLAETVELELDRARRETVGLEAGGAPHEIADEGSSQLRLDFGRGSRELEAWSALFHRYVAEQPWRVVDLAAVARPGRSGARRWVSRRLRYGLDRLTEALIKSELSLSGEVTPGPAERQPLPRRRTSFIGRNREIRRLRHLALRNRWTTLIGPPGVGKSRLALELGRELELAFRDGVALVELARLDRGSTISFALAQSLGLGDKPGEATLEAVVSSLRPLHLLLILDNCEHVLDDVRDVSPRLLAACPRLHLLATSREEIVDPAEHSVPVACLAAPYASAVLAREVRRFPAARLFEARAAARVSGYRVSDADAIAVAQICRTLEGLPLAVELAAAWTQVETAPGIAEHADALTRLLDSGHRSSRHETLDIAIAWSYDALAPFERDLLRRLSVFRGGWPLEGACAVASVADAGAVADALKRLVAQSLVTASGQSDSPRYGMLEPIRQFAANRLARSGGRETAERHLQWSVAVALQCEAGFADSTQPVWLARADVELDNFRTAFEHALMAAPETALQLACTLRFYWESRSQIGEGISLLDRALAVADADSPLRSRALAVGGALLVLRGDLAKAEAQLEEALAIAERMGDQASVLRAMEPLAHCLRIKGDLDRGRALTIAALRLAVSENDSLLERQLLWWRSHFEWDFSGPQASLPFMERAWELANAAGDLRMAAKTSIGLAHYALARGDLEAARDLTERGLSIAGSIGDFFDLHFGEWFLAVVCLHQGRIAEAEERCVRSTRMIAAARNYYGLPFTLDTLADVAVAKCQAVRAATLLGAADAVRRALGAAEVSNSTEARVSTEAGIAALIDPGMASAARERGRRMTIDEAIAFGLGAASQSGLPVAGQIPPSGREEVELAPPFGAPRRGNVGAEQ